MPEPSFLGGEANEELQIVDGRIGGLLSGRVGGATLGGGAAHRIDVDFHWNHMHGSE
jgi:hypothetical protein